jgi:prephenate dehydratase
LFPSATVTDALDAVRQGDADAALVPLENSVEGSVGVTLDELASGTSSSLMITREVLLPVTFDLYGRAGATMDSIHTVASHPHGLAQCRGWFGKHLPEAGQIQVQSTAAAAAAVARGEYDAAVCAPLAGARYGLLRLASGVGDNNDAVTRFVLVSRLGPVSARTGNDLTSLVAYIAHDRTGALLEVLTEFAVRGINLARIESRPTKERLGRYCFFLDCSGHVADARVGEALTGLRRICADVRFLGSYPRAATDDPVAARPGTSDQDFADSAAWLARIRAGTA